MKYQVYRPMLDFWANRLCRMARKEGIDLAAALVGVPGEQLIERIQKGDTLELGTLYTEALKKTPSLQNHRESITMTAGAELRYYQAGCPSIFVEHEDLAGALCRSRLDGPAKSVVVPDWAFSVAIPKGCKVKGVSVPPFLLLVSDGRVLVKVDETNSAYDEGISYVFADWDIFLESLCMADYGAGTMGVVGRLAASLCLQKIADPDAFVDGFPGGLSILEARKIKEFKGRDITPVRFAPKIDYGVRRSCVVAGHWRYLVNPCYHNGETGKVKTTWVKTHPRGKDKIAPSTYVGTAHC